MFNVTGHFKDENGAAKQFASMKLFKTRDAAFKYERDVSRKLRAEGCGSVILRTKAI